MKRWITTAVLIALAAGLTYFWPSKPVAYLNNVTELYSYYTPHMSDVVSYHLSSISCTPSEYFYSGNATCFVCNGVNACFGYVMVNYGQVGYKMNYWSNYLKGNPDNVTALSFYSSGANKALGCNPNFVCNNGIIAEVNDSDVATFVLPSNDTNQINSVIVTVANYYGFGQNCTKDTNLNIYLHCGELNVLVFNKHTIGFDFG